MSREYNRKNNNTEEQIITILKVVGYIIMIVLIIIAVKFSIKIYNPAQKKYVKNSNIAYQKIQKEINSIYKEQKQLFNDSEDMLCQKLSDKLSRTGGNCYNTSPNYIENFTIGKTKIEIWGLEKPAYRYEDTYVKDFFIDIDGPKGENSFGIDRVPVRVYSSGRLGGTLSPINCNKEDEERYGFYYAPICAGSQNINYLSTNIPFGYDVMQIGGPDGVTNKLNRKVPFLRADCIAFGGELIAGDYCEARQFSWLQACYHEYLCAIELSDAE